MSKFRKREYMMIERNKYVDSLVRKQWNGRIKILVGIRRCGKSTILFQLFKERLIADGVKESNIIEIALDDDQYAELCDPDKLSAYVREKSKVKRKKYYVLIDEIQFAISSAELKNKDKPVKLYSVLNGFLHMENIDVYVTGSNSKMLSTDISTEFRGRGDAIHVYPLSFSEFFSSANMDKRDAYDEYKMYGGMPYLLNLDTDEDKYNYLVELFDEIYFKDIEERYTIALPGVLRNITDSLCSSVGSLTNASKIARALKSVRQTTADPETISLYLRYLKDSFLFSEALRYDVKGKKYYEYPSKYYASDIGLRNARLGFRQMEDTHIMENIIYNELLTRGYAVDVGVVPIRVKQKDGKITQRTCEIDFIARKGTKLYYIQSALNMNDEEKEKMELRPILALKDSFKKIVISESTGKSWTDENGILRISLIDFLLDQNSLDQ